LYPIKEKDYEGDPMIAVNWKQIRADLRHSFMVTIFDYGAPSSDTAAIKLLKEGLGDLAKKKVNQIEIIDIRAQSEVYDAWEPFIEIHNYHSKIHALSTNARSPVIRGERAKRTCANISMDNSSGAIECRMARIGLS